MITELRLLNFKAHADTTVRFERFTVLVGPNGSGKTSVLQALELMCELNAYHERPVLSGNLHPRLLRRASSDHIRLEMSGHNTSAPWSIWADVLFREGVANAWYANLGGTLADEAITPQTVVEEVASFKGFWNEHCMVPTPTVALYKFDSRLIAAPARLHSTSPRVEPDGSDTAAVIARMKLADDPTLDEIQTSLRAIVPNVERVRVQTAEVPAANGTKEPAIGYELLFDFRGAVGVPASHVSEGTLITLALVTALHQPRAPGLVLLDDIDHAIHPKAQGHLVRLLRGMLERFSDLQIVATTHSPYVIDPLSPEAVQVFALRSDGSVAVRSLADHPDAPRMQGALSAGQIWSLDDEEAWVPGSA